MSFMMLTKDSFSQVTVDNGKVAEIGDTFLVAGLAMPGIKDDLDAEFDIPSFVKIEADTTDFALDFTETVITKGLFSEIAEEDMQDASKVTDSLKQLGTSGNVLVEGVTAIQTDIQQIEDGSSSLNDIVHLLAQSALHCRKK